MKKSRRTTQIGDQIRSEIAQMLLRDIADPEIRFVTITDVEVSMDLGVARVFVSVLGSDEEKKQTIRALERAKKRIRHLLATRARLRTTPELDFRLDETAAHADHISRLLKDMAPTEETPKRDDDTDDE